MFRHLKDAATDAARSTRDWFASKAKPIAVGTAIATGALVTPAASATPATFPDIVIPVDIATVVASITAAGIAFLLLLYGMKIGVSFFKRAANRAHKAF